jgi:bacillithiol system protein YtxJ
MEFKPLNTQDQLQEIKGSKDYNVIFKHNTTCPISKGAKSRLEQEVDELKNVKNIFMVDILENRDISDAIAEEFEVVHQSPQLLLIKDGACTYNEALSSISAAATVEAMEEN